MKCISLLIHQLASRLSRYDRYNRLVDFRNKLGYCASNSDVRLPDSYTAPHKIFIFENSNLYAHSKLIISPQGDKGRFVLKSNSSIAEGLTVVSGTHHRGLGEWYREAMLDRKYDVDKDVVVEEDVWIGANVTLLSGVTVGRGATVGAGSVCARSIPPYAIVMGNPAQIVGFNFTPEQIIQHELALYPKAQRLPFDKLEKNYEKYYVNQRENIAIFLNMSVK